MRAGRRVKYTRYCSVIRARCVVVGRYTTDCPIPGRDRSRTLEAGGPSATLMHEARVKSGERASSAVACSHGPAARMDSASRKNLLDAARATRGGPTGTIFTRSSSPRHASPLRINHNFAPQIDQQRASSGFILGRISI